MATDTERMDGEQRTLGVLDDPEVQQMTKEDALAEPKRAFEPVRVACPVCESEGTTKSGTNVCGGCGAWFVVRPQQSEAGG